MVPFNVTRQNDGGNQDYYDNRHARGCKRPLTRLSTIGTIATSQAAANSCMIYESVTSSDPDEVSSGEFRRRLGKVNMATIGFTQTGRALQIETPLGPDVLLLRSVSGQEAISQLFRFQLELFSETDDSISFDSIVGQNVTIHLQTQDSYRDFNGFISRFSQGNSDGRFTYYRAEMVPWLWFLTRKSDCRTFQKQSVPDIIQTIFTELGFSDFELRLYGPFRKRDYCVQYRETDFNFVSRLMEEEGIYYFFEQHTDSSDSDSDSDSEQQSQVAAGKHMLVLANDPAAQKPCSGQPKVRCDFAAGGGRPDDVISDWRVEEEYRPSAWAHTDYNFETPSTNLMTSVKEQGTYEIYDYPGIYAKKSDGAQLAKTRLQETLAFKTRVSGKSNCRYFTTGSTVDVTDHYRKDMNQKWMLTAVYHQCSMGEAYGSGGSDEGFFYSNTFECIPADVPFRPPRVTPKPSVQGCQTAVVTGPAGEEIYTEKYGRIKVQFHWDRLGQNNENSSCWIRVSHPWAGKGWGGISIPRIGQEVIVDFLEGDPDQPIIVGRVYHAESMPPYPLPTGAVVSGLKSNSTKGGGGYNEISMNDTKGTEMVTIHAQYDMQTTVEHDRTNTINNDETSSIVGNRTEKVGKKETITIVGAREETVSAGEKITISGGRNENVTGGETINITGGRTEGVVGDEKITVTGAQSIVVTGKRTETVNAGEDVVVTGTTNHTVVGNLTIHATGAFGQLGDGDVTINGPTITVQAKGNCNVIGGSKLTLAGPGGSIVIDGSGVTIQGTMVNIN